MISFFSNCVVIVTVDCVSCGIFIWNILAMEQPIQDPTVSSTVDDIEVIEISSDEEEEEEEEIEIIVITDDEEEEESDQQQQ